MQRGTHIMLCPPQEQKTGGRLKGEEPHLFLETSCFSFQSFLGFCFSLCPSIGKDILVYNSPLCLGQLSRHSFLIDHQVRLRSFLKFLNFKSEYGQMALYICRILSRSKRKDKKRKCCIYLCKLDSTVFVIF